MAFAETTLAEIQLLSHSLWIHAAGNAGFGSVGSRKVVSLSGATDLIAGTFSSWARLATTPSERLLEQPSRGLAAARAHHPFAR